MHLAQRGRRQRLVVELRERLRDPHAELLGHDPLDLGERERADPVLEPGERLQVGRRQQVGAGREELAELDEGRPHLLEIVGQLVGARLFAVERGRPVGRAVSRVRIGLPTQDLARGGVNLRCRRGLARPAFRLLPRQILEFAAAQDVPGAHT